MDIAQESLRLHEEWQGKLDTVPKMEIKTREDLALAYTPGVAEPCLKIHENPDDAYTYTAKGHMVAIVSDGTAVLGLGDIGPKAAIPVMEGKAVLFKKFADVDAVPICLDTKDPEEIIRTVKAIAPCFGGINLEDISAAMGISRFRMLKDVYIPCTKGTIVEMFSYLFVNSMVTISAVSFLANFRNMPLSLLIPQFDSQSLIEATAFISVVILLVNLIVKLLVYVVKRKLIKDHEA